MKLKYNHIYEKTVDFTRNGTMRKKWNNGLKKDQYRETILT
jgi:hypothetical protein